MSEDRVLTRFIDENGDVFAVKQIGNALAIVPIDTGGTAINPATYDAQTDGSQKTQVVDSSGNVVSVQYPFSTDGDSIYAKDINTSTSTSTGFSGTVTDLFDNISSVMVNSTATNPKEISIKLNRPVDTGIFRFCTATGTFSNVKIILKTASGSTVGTIDKSADSTTYADYEYVVDGDPVPFCNMVIQFHTANEVSVGYISVDKALHTHAVTMGIRDDGTLGFVRLTNGNNQKVSIEETDPSVAFKLYDDSDVAYGVKHVDNKPRVSSTPYYVDIAEGNVAGHSALFKFGDNPSVGTSYETIWSEGGLYPWVAVDAAAGIVTISSSSTNDVATTGTGAWTATIYGLNSATGAEQNETLSLNGQNAVSSNLSYSRVNRIIVNTAGTLLWNDGIIYVGTGAVGAGKPAVVWALVDATANQTLMALWTVPTGKTLYLTSGSAATSSNKGAEINIFIRPPGELFQIKYRTHIFSGDYQFKFEFPLPIQSMSDIEVRAKAVAVGGDVSATFEGWYE